MNKGSRHRSLIARARLLTACGALALGMTCTAAPTYAQNAGVRQTYRIHASTLSQALRDYGKASGRQIIFTEDLVRGKRAPALDGSFTAGEALDRLLAGSGLRAEISPAGVVMIVRDAGAVGNGRTASRQSAQTDDGAESPGDGGGARGTGATGRASEEASPEIVVTGTQIRGVSPVAPVNIFTREAIEKTGSTTLDQFSRRLSQNLANASQEGIGGGAAVADGPASTTYSQTKGSSFNLRGLGPGATLTLVNGRRTAGSSLGGDAVDISLIPLSAVEQIEVLTDGASALYGSDAIAGVVNVRLRRDYEGAESSLGVSVPTRGGGAEYRASQLGGIHWNGGGAMLGYEFRHAEELEKNDRSYLQSEENTYLQPRQRSHSLLFSVNQDLSPETTLNFDARWSSRRSETESITPIFLDASSSTSKSDLFAASLGLTRDLGAGWSVTAGADFSRSDEDVFIASIFTLDNSVTTIRSNYRNTNKAIDLKLDGPLVRLPGGDLRTALVLQHRRQDFDLTQSFGDTPNPPADVGRSSTSIAAEAFIPFVGELNRRSGIHELTLSLAARYDRYGDVGGTFNPRVGLLWMPTAALRLRGTFSTAFRAPTLNLSIPSKTYIVQDFPDPSAADGITRTLRDISVGTLGLSPETSRTISFGMDWTPPTIDGFSVRLSYYDIKFKDRVAAPPFPGNLPSQIFQPGSEALLFLVTRNPSLETVQSYYSCTDCRLIGTATRPASTVEAILDSRQRNLAESLQNGLDASASYSMENSWGTLGGWVSGTYLFSNKYLVLAGQPSIDLLNKYGLPNELRLQGGLSYDHNGFTSGLTANHVGPYANSRLTPSTRIGSWTTFDANLNYTFNTPGKITDKLTLSLNVINLFDRKPPKVDKVDPLQLAYDSANASALGRVMSLQIRKQW